MKTIVTIIILCLASHIAWPQFLFENNSAKAKADLGIKSEQGYYLMPDSSLCLMWIKNFDTQGLLLRYQDFWQCGTAYWTYNYDYDSLGNCVASTLSSYRNGFQPIRMSHRHDDRGRLIERRATDITNYATIENFSYDNQGNLTEISFTEPNNEGRERHWSKSWVGDSRYQILDYEEVFDESGRLKWTVIRQYEYY